LCMKGNLQSFPTEEFKWKVKDFTSFEN
jgi:hypothetical protein